MDKLQERMPCQWRGCFPDVRAVQVIEVAGYGPYVCAEHAEDARAVGYRLVPVRRPKATAQ